MRVLTKQEQDFVAGGSGEDYTILPGNGGLTWTDSTGAAWALLPNSNNFNSTGDIYYSGDGLAFRDFNSCVQFYADKIHDQNTDKLETYFPILGYISAIIGNGSPTEEDFYKAALVCVNPI